MDKCACCGMTLLAMGEYHPREFCILYENGSDPIAFVEWSAFRLGLIELKDIEPVKPILLKDV